MAIMFKDTFDFYRSREWARFREIVIGERQKDGVIYDEVTGAPIVRAYDIILHHKTELTDENVNDLSISLNPENILIVSHRTHNEMHDRFCQKTQEVFIVYGPPLAGKTSYVAEIRRPGDLIVDIDNIWQSISGAARYEKDARLKPVVFKIRDALLDAVKYRLGRWRTAYIIGGYPRQGERERLARELGAREVLIDPGAEACMARLAANADGRDEDEWTEYIAAWYEAQTPPGCPID